MKTKLFLNTFVINFAGACWFAIRQQKTLTIKTNSRPVILRQKKMKTIKKHFETIQQAIDYRTKLYKKYDFVKITDTPVFEGKGTYTFSVNNNPSKGQDQNY